MRIVVHDYSGHPFQVQLSRELARRGHHVWHLASADFQTPKGRLETDADLNDRLTVKQLTLGEVFQKDSFVRRRAQEEAFGRLVGREIAAIRPDVVLSSNAPLDAQREILKATRRVSARFIFWVQDLYGEAIYRILGSKLGPVGRAIGLYYRGLEYRMLRASDAAVVISGDFVPMLTGNGIPQDRVFAIENWAPLEENPYSPPVQKLADAPVRLIYSGTLGYKHNPELLTAVAKLPGVEVVVYSEGRVAEEVRAQAAGLPNLSVHGWVPFDRLPATLAAGDVLMAMIEADAGVFSVPSKVLTYLCAGRPILASVPEENLAARILVSAGAGLISPPGDIDGFVNNARQLAAQPALRLDIGECGRRYAAETFEIGLITDRFLAVLASTDRQGHRDGASNRYPGPSGLAPPSGPSTGP